MLLKNNAEILKHRILVIFVLSLTLFYFLIDPAATPIGFPCLLKYTTGWSCWGCGGQRAFHQLLHGHFKEAFKLNALVFPVVSLLAYALQAELGGVKQAYGLLGNRYVQATTLLVVTLFTIWRNVT